MATSFRYAQTGVNAVDLRFELPHCAFADGVFLTYFGPKMTLAVCQEWFLSAQQVYVVPMLAQGYDARPDAEAAERIRHNLACLINWHELR